MCAIYPEVVQRLKEEDFALFCTILPKEKALRKVGVGRTENKKWYFTTEMKFLFELLRGSVTLG